MGIVLQHISKAYSAAKVVDNLSLQIDDGEFIVMLGPSGCGKTTTLRMIAGLEQPTSGDILIQDERVNDLPPQKRDVAMVFQSYALYPHMTVRENIAYPLRVRKLAATAISAQVKQTAVLLEIERLLDRLPRELSGGERQRVALARAIVRHPKAFLMDEPLSNLDARLRLQMRGELKRLQQELATTTVYVTHDQAEAMTLGDRVAVMNHGRLQQFDTPLEIYNRPANRFVAEFVGNPGMNFISGKVEPGLRTFTAPGIKIELEESTWVNKVNGAAITLGIRPDDVQVSIAPQADGLAATVYITELMGSETLVIVEVGSQRMVARAAPEFRAAPGTHVWLKLNLQKIHLFDSDSGNKL
jgi:multiple sugar transport system ATP-binding protein